VRLTGTGRRLARAISGNGRRGVLPAALAVLAALGIVAGVLVAVLSGPPHDPAASPGSARSGLPGVRGSTGAASVITGVPLTVGAGTRLLSGSPVPVVKAQATGREVAPLRRTVQPDLLVVAPFSLPGGLMAAVGKLPGMVQAERIEAFQVPVNGAATAVLGVDPSQFRSFAARRTGAASELWQGVADGGIAVSYTMGELGKIPLGGSVVASGRTPRRLPVVAFGTLGIGGVNAVVSDATAEAIGAPAGNAIVVSVQAGDLTADSAALGRLLPKGAVVEQLVTLVAAGPAGAGPGTAAGAPATALGAMLRAAMSRRGLPYVYGAAGPATFDCSGLVQWSFAQAGITMPRVAADQALAGPAVPVSRLQPGDLLFYHTDPTAPGYISHVAIYVGNGWMIQAPQPGENVELVPADFGAEFAGAIRVSPAQAAAVAARVLPHERGPEGRGRARGAAGGVVRDVEWQRAAAVVPEDHRAAGVGLDPVRHLGDEVRVVAAAGVRVGGGETPFGQADRLAVLPAERGEPVEPVALE
jgi:cell wall-associated NlpC family hydrolase